jgi:7,8-dihydropterin-6-yl-methyl-4-(beta-D-ribofuranosyl)aminobenzene 5'-phosphate synthase
LENDRAPVYLQKDAFLPHYHGEERYIGLDTDLEKESRVIRVSTSLRIDDEVSLHPCDWHVLPSLSGSLTEQTRDGFIPDDFRHEQYLLMEENGRRILISGCSHRGIGNIMAWFHPDVLIGGFHFMKLDPTAEADQAMLDAAAEELLSYPAMYYTGHCTGEAQFAYLKAKMGDRLNYLHTGYSIEI